ncbi:class I SAM-dependent methyltransferase [Candidatus Uabimicrobium sp. HlEnr_7]|uniref:class I SAM-dependent methyltransferase n=1 Tax=Candidatus Uabimicrobium helgolandensis TaxID=3095367 RepID=UPI0035582214
MLGNYLRNLLLLFKMMIKKPQNFLQVLKNVSSSCQAHEFTELYSCKNLKDHSLSEMNKDNPLWEYFQNKSGNGIWKWEHYFDIYHKHFQHFIGKKVSILEIGVYSGGSLEMWRSYFGDNCQVYGVDIEPACKNYENSYTNVFIGDQEDRSFWKQIKQDIPEVDIVIDDGGHMTEQQRITLEEMLPFINPGGVFLCEDVHGRFHRFASFAASLTSDLHLKTSTSAFTANTSSFQESIKGIFFYPYVVVIEKNLFRQKTFNSHKHGEKWQPFL